MAEAGATAKEAVPRELRDPGSSLVDGLIEGGARGGPDAARAQHRRRISYFMLFRLVVIFVFTLLAAYTVYLDPHTGDFGRIYDGFIWAALGLGYLITVVFSIWLPRAASLRTVAWLQTSVDIVLSAVVVQISGGAESGFVFLYLLAVLGAAIMGDRGQVMAATGACALIYTTTTALHATGFALPMTAAGEVTSFDAAAVALAFARTLAAIIGVGTLSVFLNGQLVVTTQQVAGLRALNENIVRSLASGLVTVDHEGVVLFANPTALELVGVGPGALGRSTVAELLPGAEDELATGGRSMHRFELEIRRPSDNRSLYLAVTASPLLDAEDQFLGHILNFQDVTELHELNRTVARSERLAAIGQLAASVAHEVRNPLAAISGSAELLRSSPLDDEDHRLAELIYREATRLNTTVTNLLSYTRPQAPQLHRVDLSRTTREVLESLRQDPALGEGRGKIRIESSVNAPLPVRADPASLSQVLWNLLRNAVEALRGRGGELRVSTWRTASSACLRVEDDGPGIPAAELERIFEPFYSTREGGTGFGLAIVHRIIEDHHGEIDVDSQEGVGTTFTIRLPLDETTRAAPEAQAMPSGRGPARAKR